MLHGPKETQHRARRLRRAMTLPEIVLWRVLRDRPEGLRFRRQHPAGVYCLDFFCPRCCLAVEVDGEAHGRGDRPARERDAWLRNQGITVLRVTARDMLANLDAVTRHIVTVARGAAHGPLPLRGRSEGPQTVT